MEQFSSLSTATSTDPDVQRDLSKVRPLCLLTRLLLVKGISLSVKYMRPFGVWPKANHLVVMAYRWSFVTFWGTLRSDLVDVLNAPFDSGSLPPSQRIALISLIYKKRDRLLHKKWRPIRLLNVDYKLFARPLAGCLLTILHHVIYPDQTCGVRGRFIGENVALLRDVVHYAYEHNIPAAILALDQEKAFDHVDWDFLLATL